MKLIGRLTTLATITCLLLLTALSVRSTAASSEDNYAEYCVKCHGEDGGGDGPAAAVLDVKAGNFTDCERMKTLSAEYLTKIITNGGEAVEKSAQMPRVGNKLSGEEIQGLIKYIRTFCEE